MYSRRQFLACIALSLPCLLQARSSRLDDLPAAFAQIERSNGGRLGVAVLDIATGEASGYRGTERFPMCSTSNLLLETIGGPAGVTSFAHTVGDSVTRLDRTELSVNESLAGDPRDTTSPSAMAGNLRSVLLGNVLSQHSRGQLTSWMEANLTGLDRLRAKLPTGWRAADKTGSNGEHTSNDVAVIWPSNEPPVVVTAYITQCAGPETKRAAMLAQIGDLVRQSLT